MNENAIKTKWNEIKRHDMNEHETKATWNELKTKRNKNEMKTKLQRNYSELKTSWNGTNCTYTFALTGDDARALSVPVQRPGLTRRWAEGPANSALVEHEKQF